MMKNRIVEGSERKRDKSQTSTPRPVIGPKPRPSIHHQVCEHEIIDLLRQILDDTENGYRIRTLTREKIKRVLEANSCR